MSLTFKRARHAAFLLGLLLVRLNEATATVFQVGGSEGWTVPKDPSTQPYNQWAEKNRFQIGDSLRDHSNRNQPSKKDGNGPMDEGLLLLVAVELKARDYSRTHILGLRAVFVYKAGSDSVLQVSKDDYTNCNTAAPIASFTDGRTTFTFNQSGPYYFISGVEDNCKNKEKLVVIVLADRTKKPSTQPPVSPPAASPPATSPPVESPPAPSGAGAPAPEASSPPASPPTVEVPPSGNGVSSIKKSSKLAAILPVFLGPLILSVM
ncbi:Early nodulin-like protein 1 [Nymphaea thermarum]|nr:Early nodulin-like protein 1 [Nymphaea thermarum]